ncbi:MAG: hypothetical protein OXH85_08685 [Truepera sp.]|nr:hypothetical protein [Truepera sp.]
MPRSVGVDPDWGSDTEIHYPLTLGGGLATTLVGGPKESGNKFLEG